MANQKEIRAKIGSTKKTMKITSAMKLVAAAKVNKMQKILLGARPYAEKTKELFQNLQHSLSDEQKNSHPLLANKSTCENVVLVVISSDRGLCGAYNANIIKATNRRIKELQSEDKTVSLITVGRKAKVAFSKTVYTDNNVNILKSFTNLSSIPSSQEASLIAEEAVELYQNGKTDRVEVITTKFISLVNNVIENRDFLPISLDSTTEQNNNEALLEPSAEALIETLAPMYIENSIYQALLESTTSELASRMTAMSNATSNAKEFIRKLLLAYNKARQASITQEISEIVGGAAALG